MSPLPNCVGLLMFILSSSPSIVTTSTYHHCRKKPPAWLSKRGSHWLSRRGVDAACLPGPYAWEQALWAVPLLTMTWQNQGACERGCAPPCQLLVDACDVFGRCPIPLAGSVCFNAAQCGLQAGCCAFIRLPALQALRT